MPSEVSSGTQAAVINTEHTLYTGSSLTYIFVVDTSNMANGDQLELRIYSKCRASSSEQLAYLVTYANAQATNVKYSPPLPGNNDFKATLKQTAGTGRSYDWAVLQP